MTVDIALQVTYIPCMAPFIGPKKEKVLRILRSPDYEPRLPMWIGMMSPKAMMRLHEGRFQLVPLVLDEEAAAAEGDRRIARGEAWLPEMTWAFLRPGAPAIDCGTLAWRQRR